MTFAGQNAVLKVSLKWVARSSALPRTPFLERSIYGRRESMDTNSRFRQLRATAIAQPYGLENALCIVSSDNRACLPLGSFGQRKPIEQEALIREGRTIV
jgi:hypothetical protein